MSGGFGGSKSKSSSTQTSNPWGPWQPFAQDIYGEAQGLYDQGPPAYYPGSTYTPFNDIQQGAFDATLNRAGGSAQEAGLGNWINRSLQQPNFNLGNAGQMANYAASGVVPGMQGLMRHQQGLNPYQASRFSGAGLDGPMGAGQSLRFSGAGLDGPMSAGQSLGFSGAGLDGPMSAGQSLGFSGAGLDGPIGAGQSLGFSRSQDQGLNNQYQSLLNPSVNYTNRLLSEDPTLQGRIGDIQRNVNTQVDPTARAALTQSASGAMLGGNPYLDQVISKAQKDVLPGLNQTFGAAGRTGSAAHQGEVTETLGDIAGNIRAANYDTERQNQLAAANQLGSLGLQGSGLGLSAAGLGADVYKADAARQLGAAGLTNDIFSNVSSDLRQQQGLNLDQNRLAADLYSQGQNRQLNQNQLAADIYGRDADRSLGASQGLTNTGLQGVNALGDLFSRIASQQQGAASLVPQHSQMQWNNIAQMLGIGDRVQDQSENVLQDDINRFNYYQGAPWENLMRYASTIFAQQPTSSTGTQSSKSGGFNVGF